MSALSAKRQAFVANYLLDFNAAHQAAIRAGYSPRYKHVTGHRANDANVGWQNWRRAGKSRPRKRKSRKPMCCTCWNGNATAGDFASPNTARIRAIELLAKIHGMLTDKVQVEQTGPPPTINVRFGKPAADETQQTLSE